MDILRENPDLQVRLAIVCNLEICLYSSLTSKFIPKKTCEFIQDELPIR